MNVLKGNLTPWSHLLQEHEATKIATISTKDSVGLGTKKQLKGKTGREGKRDERSE